MTKLKSPYRKSNPFAIFLKVFAVFLLVLGSLIGVSYGSESGGVATFVICFLVSLAVFAIFYAMGEGLTILHDMRNKLYDK